MYFLLYLIRPAFACAAGEQLLQPQPKADLATQHSITSAHEYGSQQQHHHQQHAQQQQHQYLQRQDCNFLSPAGHKATAAGAGGAAAGGGVHMPAGAGGDAGGDVRGRFKGRKRGVVADICWMLQIRTFQVGR
jgi:hypothetical protein